MDYSKIKDDELAVISKKDDKGTSEIITRYKETVSKIAKKYYIKGGDENDLLQEGYLGVYGAIKSYDGKSDFRAYALKCIKNSILSAVRRSNRKKNKPLDDYYSLSSVSDDYDDDKNDFIKDMSLTPEERVIEDEKAQDVFDKINMSLSVFEKKVLNLRIEGFTLGEISTKTGKAEKSVENAIYRIKKKASTLKEDEK